MADCDSGWIHFDFMPYIVALYETSTRSTCINCNWFCNTICCFLCVLSHCVHHNLGSGRKSVMRQKKQPLLVADPPNNRMSNWAAQVEILDKLIDLIDQGCNPRQTAIAFRNNAAYCYTKGSRQHHGVISKRV
jgi:hypothetical protein